VEDPSTEENVTLVDTIDDPSLDWVGAEPRGIALVYCRCSRHAYTVVEHGGSQPGFQKNFVVMRPSIDARICSEFTEYGFPMYEIMFRDLGLKLPFSDFQAGVFCHLNLAPSQLHPNSIAFLLAFELTCRFLRIGAKIPLFFRVFHLQRQSRGGRHSKVSLKHSKRLFKMYMDLVRGFKDKWYVLQPVTHTALDSLFEAETAVVDEDGEPPMDVEGRPAVGRVSKFPIHWFSGHYDHGTGYYHTPAGSMSAEDEEAYVVLCKYFDSFFPARWVTREGKIFLTRKGDMTEQRERLLKLTQDKKVNKRLVRAPSGNASSGSPGSPDAEQPTELITRKRSRVDNRSEVGDESVAARAFGLPPCFKGKDFFEGFPLMLSNDEAETIRRLDKESRRKHLAASMVGMVKMAEMAVILSDEGSDSSDRVRELDSEKAALAASSRKLKAALERSEEMFREQADLLAGEKENSGKVAEERDCLQLDKECLETDNERLSKEVEELKAAILPADDESEETAPLRTRSDLVTRIHLLETDCVGALADGFEAAVSQLAILNPGMNTEGVGFMSQIIDGQVVPPPESSVVDAGSPGNV
ncbi:hypothetical protein RYX36_029723, partial [Vicia faba]